MAKPEVTKKELVEEEKGEDDDEEDEETSKLPFPNAVVVRLIRNNLPKGMLIKKRVKVAMNQLLADICEEVSQEMGKEPYAYLDYSAFQKAAKKYLDIRHVEKDKERTILTLKKLNADVDAIIRGLERVDY